MSADIRCYDQSTGKLLFNIASQTSRIVGYVTDSSTSGTITVPDLGGGKLFWMLLDDDKAEEKAKKIWDDLGDLSMRKSNDKRLSLKYVKNLGIKAVSLEEIKGLEEHLLNIHYILIQTFANTPLLKIIENQDGVYFSKNIN